MLVYQRVTGISMRSMRRQSEWIEGMNTEKPHLRSWQTSEKPWICGSWTERIWAGPKSPKTSPLNVRSLNIPSEHDDSWWKIVISWYFMILHETSWDFMRLYDVSWYFMIFHDSLTVIHSHQKRRLKPPHGKKKRAPQHGLWMPSMLAPPRCVWPALRRRSHPWRIPWRQWCGAQGIQGIRATGKGRALGGCELSNV